MTKEFWSLQAQAFNIQPAANSDLAEQTAEKKLT
jgi:hypothetical protein